MAGSSTDRPLRPWAFLAAAGALACLAACAPARQPGPLLLHPVPPPVEGYSLAQGAIVFAGPDFTVSARPWDYRLVAQELAAGGGPSPFGDGEEGAGRFLFVRLRFENRSTRTLVFNPLRASLLQEGEGPLVPLENSDLFAFAGEDLPGAEARGRTFRRIAFDGAATVRAGETLERLLVFATPEQMKREVGLALDDLWAGSTSYDLRFPFEAYPGK